MPEVKIQASPLPVIMTMSQHDLDYITQLNGSNVGAIGSFTGDISCPDAAGNPRNLMECRFDSPNHSPIHILPANLSVDGSPYKIIIGNYVFGVGLH